MSLDLPRLSIHEDVSGVRFFTDDALRQTHGVCIGFTERGGGVSPAPFASLNLGRFAGEGQEAALANINRLMRAVCAQGKRLLNPKQVHGTDIFVAGANGDGFVDDADSCGSEGVRAPSGDSSEVEADAVVVERDDTFALLCFADCVPLVLVAPDGTFAVAHSGWRGTYGHIAVKTLATLAQAVAVRQGIAIKEAAGMCNVYLGPFIHGECFEVGKDTFALFAEEFGQEVLVGKNHVDLGAAIKKDLIEAGADPQRIADVDVCTVCTTDRFFSYRAEQGVCGRHGAFAFRE